MSKNCASLGPLKLSSCLTKKNCGYHPKGNESFEPTAFAPEGCCPDAFYAAYPYILALLYDGQAPQLISCPNATAPCLLRVNVKPKRLRLLINLAEKALRAVGIAKDAIDKFAVIEVVKHQGRCEMKEGQRFRVDIPDRRRLCPASFFSVYPWLRAIAPECKSLSFACPDPASIIRYDLHPTVQAHAKEACRFFVDLSGYEVRTLEANPECWVPAGLSLLHALPEGVCPTLFNIAVPYLLTLRGGGYFKWRIDADTVDVECPSLEGVEFQVRRKGPTPDTLSIHVDKVRGSCPSGHCPGQEFDVKRTGLACFHLLPAMFLELAGRPREATISCPVHRNTRYLITRASVP